MRSLIQKIQDEKKEAEIAKAHKEALQMEDRLKCFYGNNQGTSHRIASEVENGSIQIGETMLVTYWDGKPKPVFGRKKQARGKIRDIQYNLDPTQDKVEGYVVLKTSIFRKERIPLSSIETAEYKPEVREAQEKNSSKKRKQKEKAWKQKRKQEDYLFGCANGYNHILNHITLHHKDLLKMRTAESIINEICRDNGWIYVEACGRGSRTGRGYGNLRCAGALDSKGRIVAGIKMYESLDDCLGTDPKFFPGCGEVYPTISSIANISDDNLRRFIAGFYARLYSDELVKKK